MELRNSRGGRPLSRRTFLKALGATGASAAVLGAMQAWGLAEDSGQAEPPDLSGEVNGTRVIVIGAGPAGLATAYELMQLGYDVKVFEARGRVGGHVFTVRRGAVSEEIGTYPQVARFDPGQYYNAGAWRIPYYHRATLYYPKLFGTKMIVHKNVNHQAYAYMERVRGQQGGRKLRLRELYADMTGHTSEILAKAVSQDALDLELTQDDREDLLSYLVQEGVLSSSDYSYGPNNSRGVEQFAGPGNQPEINSSPLALLDILGFATATANQASIIYRMAPLLEMQETMQTPEEGMSAIYEKGFLPHLRERVQFNAVILEIHQAPRSAWIVYRNKETGETEEYRGDYIVSTIPLSVLKDIPADFSAQYKAAIEAGSNYLSVGKMGLQFKRRFWEEDDWIYGGITFMDRPEISTISYPTWGMLTQKGVLQAYYNYGDDATRVGDMSPQERIETALAGGELVHGPAYRDEFESGFSVSWDRVRYSLGGWSGWSEDDRERYYPVLLEPDGRIYLAGEMLSYLPGWQEGAISAAWMQVEKLHQRVMQSQNL
jgi:monoamine oxidase